MTDDDIHEYLIKHNWAVNSHEFISIMNESPQIEGTEYNSQNNILTVTLMIICFHVSGC